MEIKQNLNRMLSNTRAALKNKFILIPLILVAVLAISLSASYVLAPTNGGGGGGISYDQTLTLENKEVGQGDCGAETWKIISDGTQATLYYNSIGLKFEYKLESSSFGEDYVLIYYADQPDRFTIWGGAPALLLGTLPAGQTVLEGSVDTGDLPSDIDWNKNPNPDYCDCNNGHDDYEHCYGAKIWLIPLSDYNGVDKVLKNWNPQNYLFETDLIYYVKSSYNKLLILENKEVGQGDCGAETWKIITDDKRATLEYNEIGPNFEYSLTATGLQPSTDYSLVYYADFDPRFTNWGGNNPGALITTAITDGSGDISKSSSTNLGMDLPSSPDWNIDPDPDYCDCANGHDDYDYCSGAKIWLVPSSDYDESGQTIYPSWNPDTYLFETDLITYTESECFPGEVEQCGEGACAGGEKVCDETGQWGSCSTAGTECSRTAYCDNLETCDGHAMYAVCDATGTCSPEENRDDNDELGCDRECCGECMRWGCNIDDNWDTLDYWVSGEKECDNGECTDDTCVYQHICADTDLFDGWPIVQGIGSVVACNAKCDQDSDCDDGVGCTDDRCNSDCQCENIPNDANCDDGLWCNGAETCDAKNDCQPGTPPNCDDGVDCTDDSCDETNDVCVNTPNDANCPADEWVDTGNTKWVDDTDCTEKEQKEQEYRDHYCDASSDCQYTVTSTQWVDTDNIRNKPDGTSCGFSTDTDCDNPDTCSSGVCVDNYEAVGFACGDQGDTVCDDPNTCDGSGSCSDNYEPATTVCRVDAGDCDVAEYCTGSSADCPSDVFEPDDIACDDGLYCSVNDKCTSGVCGGSARDCSDSNECTDDACNENLDKCENPNLPGGTECGSARDCPTDACNNYFAEFYPVNGHDTCDGAGTCVVYSCDMEDSYCTDDDSGDGVNALTCGAQCDQDSDCEDYCGEGGIRYYDGDCDLSETCSCSWLSSKDCDDYDCSTPETYICEGVGSDTIEELGDDYSCVANGEVDCGIIGTMTCDGPWTCDYNRECGYQDCGDDSYQCYKANPTGGWTWGTPPGTETDCDDGYDNDCDCLVDCEDPDCDKIPPETTKEYGEPRYTDGVNKWINSSTPITLNAEDDGGVCSSDVDETYYAILSGGCYRIPTLDGDVSSEEWGDPVFSGVQTNPGNCPFDIYIVNDGDNLYIAAKANTGAIGCNWGTVQSLGLATALNIYIDANPPTPFDGVVDDGDIAVIASDDELYIAYDSGANDWDWQGPGSFSANGGEIAADGDYVTGNGIVEIKIPFSLSTFSAGDTIAVLFQPFGNDAFPVVPDVHPNWPETYTNHTLYVMPTPSWQTYMDPFNIDECEHTILYYSVDNFGNEENVKSQCVFVDNSAPEPNKTVDEPRTEWYPVDAVIEPLDPDATHFYPDIVDECWKDGEGNILTEEGCRDDENCMECWKVTLNTKITLDCNDPDPHPVGHETTCFNVEVDGVDKTERYCERFGEMNKDGFCCGMDAPYEFKFREETEHNLKYYCVDALENKGEIDEEKFKVLGRLFKIRINKKWNLISVPFDPMNPDPEEVFENTPSVQAVWTYDGEADKWFVYRPGVDYGTSNLDKIETGYGYWVLGDCEDPIEHGPRKDFCEKLIIGGSLYQAGPVTPPSRDLVVGWNLIGYYGTEGRKKYKGPDADYDEDGKPAYCALYSIVKTNLVPKWGALLTYWEPYNTLDQWIKYGIILDNELDPGAGYWIHMKEDGNYAPSTACVPFWD